MQQEALTDFSSSHCIERQAGKIWSLVAIRDVSRMGDAETQSPACGPLRVSERQREFAEKKALEKYPKNKTGLSRAGRTKGSRRLSILPLTGLARRSRIHRTNRAAAGPIVRARGSLANEPLYTRCTCGRRPDTNGRGLPRLMAVRMSAASFVPDRIQRAATPPPECALIETDFFRD